MEQSWKFSWTCLCLLTVLVVSQPAYGQPGQFLIREFDEFYQLGEADVKDLPNEAATHLARADELVANRNWDEAVETLRRVAENYGTRLNQADQPQDKAGGSRFLNVRAYCQRRLAQLPDAARQLYRERVDAVADTWYTQGIEQRDEQILQRIVDQLFSSSRGDDALLALGDIALEKGHTNAARWYWERISPLTRLWDGRAAWYSLAGLDADQNWEKIRPQFQQPVAKPTWPVYPDTDLNLGDIRARLVLASILEGAADRAELELNLLRRLHPDDAGYLAGVEGNYVETLDKLLSSSRAWPARQAGRDWPTFAGAMVRTRQRPEPFDLLGPPTWHIQYSDVQLKPTAAESNDRQRGTESDLAFHPVIVDDLVLIKNSSRIFAYDAKTGRPAFGAGTSGQLYPAGEVRGRRQILKGRGLLSEPRYTLTVHRDKLYARIGSQATTNTLDVLERRSPNRLVCLDLRTQGGLKWQHPINAHDAAFSGWSFEGAPVADADGVYVCMRRTDSQPEAHVACLDASTGRLRWRRRVCSANFPTAGAETGFSHTMLTLAEGTLYLNTNLGAVAAIRARDGLVHWVYRYPRTEVVDMATVPEYFYRDLNPCVFYRGLIIAAPRDSQQIMALDAGSGQLVWRSIPLGAHPLHLLGVGNGNLIATGRSVWWLNAVTGRAEFVWPHPDNAESERGYGRGLLAGNIIYWPTREKILVFDQRIGRDGESRFSKKTAEFHLAVPNINAAGGNLVVGRDTFLIAGADALYGFRLNNPKSEIRNPKSKRE